LLRGQAFTPGRHPVGSPLGDRGVEIGIARAVNPDAVAEVRAHAATRIPGMAARAIHAREELPAGDDGIGATGIGIGRTDEHRRIDARPDAGSPAGTAVHAGVGAGRARAELHGGGRERTAAWTLLPAAAEG